MEFIERAIRNGVVFTAVDLKDGGPILFRWHRDNDDNDDNDECAVGFERLVDAARDACHELALTAAA